MDNKQALRFEKFGNPDVLELQEAPVTEPGEGEVLVKVAAASVNPSDVKNVAGALKATLPRTPGRDFAGIVVSPGEWTGLEVWGAGYEFGVKRDGSHAEYLHVPVAGLAPKPNNLSMSQAAACGVPFLAAWMGLVDTAQLRSGQRVLITGVHGAVGQAAVQIARWRGCEVIGADRSDPVNDSPYVRTSDSNWPDRVREWSKGGVDVVLDAVGGVLFESCLHCLRQGGQQIAIASTGDPHVSFHLPDFFHELLHLSGADTFKLASQDIARIMGELRIGFEKGELVPPRIQEHSLKDARKAYEAVSRGSSGVRQVIVFN